ncbi:MAG: L-threonylcarbamoyladenylate synthase [Pseudomonadota bacterium]|nr:L-threonylcarbamoyladenylate synthase [Pseudomonadota bacterium]MDP1903258.1 L-threonylcarbamoyladenylate synthase [Pseudomonadota bacterium]MDP2352767.1 L-threonylcarbamoyladenylate synthase [Pseudomonadota bacterium]
MARVFDVHPDNPQPRALSEAVRLLRQGGVMVYPTDSCYAIGCMIGNKDGMASIRRIHGVDEKHHFTLICRDLSEIARYARVDNSQYRFLKSATPGGYTFILEATREVPRRLLHPKRSTIGLRVPDNKVIAALLEELNEPILSMTLQLPGHEYPLNDPDDILDCLDNQVEVILTCGYCGIEPTTVIDLTGPVPEVIRQGTGDVARLGLQ